MNKLTVKEMIKLRDKFLIDHTKNEKYIQCNNDSKYLVSHLLDREIKRRTLNAEEELLLIEELQLLKKQLSAMTAQLEKLIKRY